MNGEAAAAFVKQAGPLGSGGLHQEGFAMTLIRSAIVGAGFWAGLGAAAPSGASAAEMIHVRGTVATVEGNHVTVHTREGKDVALTLGDNWKLGGVQKAGMADIKAGTFIGTANTVGPTGAKALEVVVFPEAMRGTGEGDYGWDLKPQSAMTNATVSNPVQGVDGQTVTLTYKGGEKKVTIPPDVPIVTLVPATAGDVKPGAAVFISGAPDASGAMMEKGFLAVGKDGVTPPM